VTIFQRKERLSTYSGKDLIITTNNGTEYYIGNFQ